MRKLLVLYALVYLYIPVQGYAQKSYNIQDQYKFKALTIDQGLSNNFIQTICQDSEGFIWFGTHYGLNKYDGVDITTYYHDPDNPSSISSNYIHKVFLDSKGHIWIGSNGGLDMYNADHDNFIRLVSDSITWPMQEVFDIDEDKNGVLWFGGETGLYNYNLNSQEINFFSNKENNPHGIAPNIVYKILVDKNDNVWISVLNEGLYLLNQTDTTFTIYKNDPTDSHSISGNRIEVIYEDTKGNIWAGTLNHGLNRFLPEINSFEHFKPDPDHPYSSRVRAIFEDLKGNFFIGTRAGLYLRDDQTGEFIHYAYEGHLFSNLSQNSIIDSYIDNYGILWIGTFSGGVNYTDLNKKAFIHYMPGIGDNHFINGANVFGITEDTRGNLWIGGENGLNYLDRKSYTFSYIMNDPENTNSLSYNDVKSLEWDKNGNLWIGTNLGGLNHYNLKTGKFKCYKHDPDDPGSISGNKIYSLLNDSQNNLWVIISPNNSFNYLDVDILPDGQDKFIHLDQQSYFGFDEDSAGNVYFGGVHGFWKFARKDSVFSFFEEPDLIDKVNTIMVDSRGNIWVGSQFGLVRFNNLDSTFISYSKETGYPVDEVYGILEDDSENLWISTNSGLLKVLNAVKDTALIDIHVFDHYDGLQSKQFNYHAYYKCKSGEMIFGGINGFNTFFPSDITESGKVANVVLTNLKIFNKDVPIGEKTEGSVVLKKSISITDKIVLGPRQNIFTLEFAAFQYSNPDKYLFKTKLEGLDDNWQYRKAGNNQVTYTNLRPGDYTFMVSAANGDGIWNPEPRKLMIHIRPAFVNTWGFRIGLFIALLLILYFIYSATNQAIRRRNQLLERTVNIRTQELFEKNSMLTEANELLHDKQEEILSQKQELELHRNNLEILVEKRTHDLEQALERAQESDAMKSSFLANMSHEIRTPMNAIMGFSNLLKDSDISEQERNSFVEIIKSNSTSLLKIIDEILDLSIIESNKIKIVKTAFSLNVLIDQLFTYYSLNFKSSAFVIRKNNTLEDSGMVLSTDIVRIKQIITNLMDNACKFTIEGFVELGATISKGNLCVYVQDSGKGIPKNELENIFQQFIKIEDNDSAWTRGLGLGLAISQRTSEALGGKIYVESELGKGSTFTLSLPLQAVLDSKTQMNNTPQNKVKHDWHGKTILIAEDVEENYFYLENVLKRTLVRIIWARDGEEAIKKVKETPGIDIILMDIKMPVLNGYDAAKQIKSESPDMIIIAQTAYATKQEKHKFFDNNFDEYITKPTMSDDLYNVLEKFLS